MCTTKTAKIDRLHATTEHGHDCNFIRASSVTCKLNLYATQHETKTTFTGTHSNKMTLRSNRFADVLKFSSKLVCLRSLTQFMTLTSLAAVSCRY